MAVSLPYGDFGLSPSSPTDAMPTAATFELATTAGSTLGVDRREYQQVRPYFSTVKADPQSTDAIRPTEYSSPAEIFAYLDEATGICAGARSELISSGIVRAEDLRHVFPVEGCFVGDPPKPRVTLSEVIAVILNGDTVRSWVASGDPAIRLRAISKAVKDSVRHRRNRGNYRTYVLIYADMDETNQTEHNNSLLLADFDEGYDISKRPSEFLEKWNLIESLSAHFGREAVEKATAVSGNKLSKKADISLLSKHLMFSLKHQFKYPTIDDFIIICSAIFLLAMIASCVALVMGAIISTDAKYINSVGIAVAISGVILLILSEWSAMRIRPRGNSPH